jgi:hypothetical protein
VLPVSGYFLPTCKSDSASSSNPTDYLLFPAKHRLRFQ